MTKALPIGLEQKQSLQQAQRLILTPQMHQALHLLQLPILELSTLVEQEMETNPALEYEEDLIDPENPIESDAIESLTEEEMPVEKALTFDEHDYEILRKLDEDFREYMNEETHSYKKSQEEERLHTFKEAQIQNQSSLFEYLMKQAHEIFETQEDLKVAELLIGNFDEKGFLGVSLEEISMLENISMNKLKTVLQVIQTFDPHGVGATSLVESLLIQLQCRNKTDSLAYKIVSEHFEDLIHNRLPLIKKNLKCSIAEIRSAITKDIAKLDLHPGTLHNNQYVPYITADVLIKEEGGELLVNINDEILPPLRLNHQFFKLLKKADVSSEAKEYMKQKIAAGRWLLKSLNQRQETLYKIGSLLAKKQKEYFISHHGQLSPMTMKSVAEELQLHESTIARAVANKYLACPRGLVPLRSFFTNAYHTAQGTRISSRTVKETLVEILTKEDKSHPWSDEEISKKIQEEGIICARRTVTKYRKELNIGSTTQRKEF